MNEVEREVLEADVLLIGAGPASLACAYHLARQLRSDGDEREIVVLEKSAEVGEHILSGAVMDGRGLDELFPEGWREAGCPVDGAVTEEAVYYLTATGKLRFPFIPPPLRAQGCHVVSLSHVVRWLRERVEELGVNVFEGFPAAELLWDGDRVIGARTVDQGVDRQGAPRDGFTPGTEVRAKVTVLGEGSRGSLTKTLVERLGLEGPNPQIYAIGIKEIWEIPAGRFPAGRVVHTAGWPLSSSHYGGGWVYGLSDSRVSIGFVPALDGGDPYFNPWEAAQRWKTHPWLHALLEGGTLLKAGAKTVPEGGLWSQPRLYGDGFVIVGDAGSFLNAPRLKGIHTAIKSGMLAAETLCKALRAGSTDRSQLADYDLRYRESWLYRELRRVRNMRQAFGKSFVWGMMHAGLLYLTGGRLLRDRLPARADSEQLEKLPASSAQSQTQGEESWRPDGVTTFDRETGVFHAAAVHEEDQPSHLVVVDTDLCATRCREEYGNPCEHFCPAHVYEMVEDPDATASDGAAAKKLEIHHSGCVHCKTCDIMDPYGVITWTVPPDAGGPNYVGM
jgi:electron-transferring-flavoprotein dehydrogenase